MVNKERGEVAFEAGGETYTLCLTLNALAEIEAALGVDDVTQLGENLRATKGRHVRAVLGALLRGGGHTLSDDEAGSLSFSLKYAIETIGEAIIVSGLLKSADGEPHQAAAAGGSAEEPAKN